ncbi:MAG: protein kinase [Acidobacteria bacterium]|nr:protein kinase [Acidobacteriota bacterium]
MEIPVPEKIGRFTIRRVIGQGGMGTVYLGHDEELDRDVALKVLHNDDVEHRSGSRSLREARTAASIRHPNVATIYEIGKTAGDLTYIAMEYCEGETLSSLARTGELDLRRFLGIALQIAEGIAAAHANGVVHRDIKSSNILIERGDRVKILDFGLAKSFEMTGGLTMPEASTVTKFFGTIPYISPEQASGQSADALSDLFSTGVVLYELITGHLPFTADNPLALIQKIREDEPQQMQNQSFAVPPSLGRIISTLLQKNPSDRFGSARELAEHLRAVQLELSESRTWTLPERSGYLLPRTVRRLSLPTILIVVGVMAGLLAVTGWYLSNRASPLPDAPPGPIRSLAVLPLQNLSGEESDEFLSVGIPDALIVRLQQIRHLQVRPTSAILPFKDRRQSALEIADDLEVDAVLEGHFVTAGDQIRVNLQLIDARTNYGVWAGAIDGTRDDLLALMDLVSTRTFDALRENLRMLDVASPSQPNTTDPRAYEHYLRARSLTGSLLAGDHQEQIDSLLAAIALDPEFAAAHAELAIALSLGQVRGLEPAEGVQSPEWYARQAVRIDPNLAEAHVALSRALVRQPDRFRESLRENLAALRINPNEPNALSSLATYFISIGDLRRAECIKERFVELDPSSNDARTRGYWSINAVDPDSALRESRLATRTGKTALAGHDIEAMAHLMRGDIDGARRAAARAAEIHPDHYIAYSLAAMIAAAEGNREEAVASLEQFSEEASTSNHWAAFRVALTWARLGEQAEAVKWLRKTVELGNHSWYLFIRHPWLSSLQPLPEFQRLISGIRSQLDDVRDDTIGMHRLLCQSAPASLAPAE